MSVCVLLDPADSEQRLLSVVASWFIVGRTCGEISWRIPLVFSLILWKSFRVENIPAFCTYLRLLVAVVEF